MTESRDAGQGPRSPGDGGAPAAPQPLPDRAAKPARPPRRPDPPPLEIDESRVILIGMIGWAVAFVVMICFHSRLARDHHSWYPWTALVGIGLGLWGWWLVRKRVAARGGPPGKGDEQ